MPMIEIVQSLLAQDSGSECSVPPRMNSSRSGKYWEGESCNAKPADAGDLPPVWGPQRRLSGADGGIGVARWQGDVDRWRAGKGVEWMEEITVIILV